MEELVRRKPTRLYRHDYSTPGAYFITVCTKNKKKILSIVGDGALDVPKIQLTDKGKIIEKYILSTNKIENVSVNKYVIMPNHIHMIITITPIDIDGTKENGTTRAPSPTNEMIPRIVSALKRFCNREIGENIFQRSYHDHIIRNQDDYDHIWNYIEQNPMYWKNDCFYIE